MDKLQVLAERDILGQEFNIYGTQEEPMFLAKDISDWIEHSNTRMMLKNIDEDEKGVSIVYTLGGNQEQWFLTENGLYEVLMQSRKPVAKIFKKQVKQILKDIRKHGIYATDEVIEQTLKNPDYMIEILTNYKEEKSKRQQAEQQIEQQKPKVLFADTLAGSDTSILVQELAKLISQNGYSIGQNKLFEWLRENGYVIKKKGESWNLPTQRSIDLGILDIKKGTKQYADGTVIATRTTKVTVKGQKYFINKFLKDKAV